MLVWYGCDSFISKFADDSSVLDCDDGVSGRVSQNKCPVDVDSSRFCDLSIGFDLNFPIVDLVISKDLN